MSDRSQRFDHLMHLIDNVYEAALDEERWRDLAPHIAQTFDSTSTTLQIQRTGDSSRILSMTDNVSARFSDYCEHYWRRDIWVERAVQLIGMSRVGSSRDMVSDSEFQETEFYRDWCRHLDVFYVVGAVFPSGPGEMGVLGIHRPRSAGSYEEEDKFLVSRFMPHLQRALRIREQLSQAALQRRVSSDTLERCDTAVLLVAADGLIVHANRRAEELLAAKTSICQRSGRLNAVGVAANARLSALIHAANHVRRGCDAEGTMSLRRAGRQPLTVLIAPFRMTWAGYPSAGSIVFIRDPDRTISALGTLRALFHFTPTEAKIAQALVNGSSISEIATAHRTSLQTVRKQLKAILAKTGTNRQAQCVALILRSVAMLAEK